MQDLGFWVRGVQFRVEEFKSLPYHDTVTHISVLVVERPVCAIVTPKP